ncbi:MAG: hypothetical protein ACK5NS_15950 [Denitromonas sp.]
MLAHRQPDRHRHAGRAAAAGFFLDQQRVPCAAVVAAGLRIGHGFGGEAFGAPLFVGGVQLRLHR